MRSSELTAQVGRLGQLTVEGLRLSVRVVDAKVSYGKLRLLVQPTDEQSSGQMWVEEGRVR